ncbi:hypothetical protein BHE74_00027038 [Ensete ventricosum]|nr:hypothetical protein GW17_00043734 [Ensete ventricosum]RWW65644.1 hypothetical protein BHE74_00027038 [Ensete ventricosum]RZS06000.1 hypothetical protein BHM03_00036579 [Ensete ventricosum]
MGGELREDYDKADQDADEWRAREIAKDMARRKVESMKEIAKLKSREERKKLESEVRHSGHISHMCYDKDVEYS